MKRFCPAAVAALALFLGGCATETRQLAFTGDILVDGPNVIAHGPPRDRVLWEYRTAAAALRRGNYEMSKQMLDDALRTLGGIYGKDENAKQSRSYFYEESRKTFIGEPYERGMAWYYRGILYWMDGEPDNARACFRSGQFEDGSSVGAQYNGDYVLLDYLDGLVTRKLGGDGSDAFARAEQECKNFRKPPPYDPQANVLFFIEFGLGPLKYATGEYGEELRFNVAPSAVYSAVIKIENQIIAVGPYDDLGFQATTRGGRVMDHVLANKAVFKKATDVAGTIGMVGGVIAAGNRNQSSQELGWALIAAGIVSKMFSASITPAADTRMWDNLPRYLSFAAVSLPPGTHTARVEFLDRAGQPMSNLAKTLTINVTADKPDKVVFVSDDSTSPQSF